MRWTGGCELARFASPPSRHPRAAGLRVDLRFWRWPLARLLRRASVGYLVVWVLSPPLAYGQQWRVAAILATGLWLLLELRASRSVLLRPSWPVLGAFGFVFYTAGVEWAVPDSAGITYHFQVWIMLFFLLVGESLARGRDDDARFYFWLVLLVLPVWSLATLRGIETISQDVARTISRSSAEARELSERGIGGYGFVYAVLLSLPFLYQMVLRARASGIGRGWWWRAGKALLALNALVGSLLVIRAGYSIALVLAGSALALVLLARSRRPLPLAMSVCLSALLVLAGTSLVQPALERLQDVATGTEYASKVRDVRSSLARGEGTGTVEGRTERYGRSLQLTMEHPVGGTLAFDPVGKHSAILDRFAQYGVLLGGLFLGLLAYLPWRALRDRRVPVGLALAFLVVGLGFPFLDTIFMAWGLLLFVFSRGALAVMGVPLDRRRPSAPPSAGARTASAWLAAQARDAHWTTGGGSRG